MDQPNVILIVCDDLNDSIEGMGGHEQAKTPNINHLIEEGVKFSNCQASVPLCGPSRASFLTGIYPHNSGYFGYKQQQNHWRNNPVLKDAVTIMEHCTNNGYAVYGTGKVFHNGHEDWSVWKGNGDDEGFGIGPSFGPWPWDGITDRGNIGCGHPAMPEPLCNAWEQGFLPLSEIPEYKPDPEQNIPGYKGWRL
ncbi:MAG: sulfatase-like hydrolase/transferase, partial [Halanaerobiales bacterium]